MKNTSLTRWLLCAVGLWLLTQQCAQCFYSPGPIRATRPVAKANPSRFSSKSRDNESDPLYYGYRYYNASTGRWLNRDPKGEKGELNLYGFVFNAPTEKVDRFGLDAALVNAGGATGHTMFIVGNSTAGLTIFHFYALGTDGQHNCCRAMIGICCDKAWIWKESAADWDDAIHRAQGHGSPVQVWDYAVGTPAEDKSAYDDIVQYMKGPGYYSLIFGRNCHTKSYDWFMDYVAGGHEINVIRPPDSPSWWPQVFWVTPGRAGNLAPQWPLQ